MNVNNPVPTPSSGNNWSAVPRAVWIGGGVLAIAAAAMGGALISQSSTRSEAPAPQLAAAPDAGRPVPTNPPIGSSMPMAPNDGVPPPPQQPLQAPVTTPAPRAQAPKPAVAAARPDAPRSSTPAVCATCGVVESVVAVREKGEGSGVGAVTGGVLGGVVGNQIGGGNGRAAMTVLGAIGGGFAGNEVEKRTRSVTRYDVRVRMDNGSLRTFERADAMPVGTPVTVNGSTMRIASR